MQSRAYEEIWASSMCRLSACPPEVALPRMDDLHWSVHSLRAAHSPAYVFARPSAPRVRKRRLSVHDNCTVQIVLVSWRLLSLFPETTNGALQQALGTRVKLDTAAVKWLLRALLLFSGVVELWLSLNAFGRLRSCRSPHIWCVQHVNMWTVGGSPAI